LLRFFLVADLALRGRLGEGGFLGFGPFARDPLRFGADPLLHLGHLPGDALRGGLFAFPTLPLLAFGVDLVFLRLLLGGDPLGFGPLLLGRDPLGLGLLPGARPGSAFSAARRAILSASTLSS